MAELDEEHPEDYYNFVRMNPVNIRKHLISSAFNFPYNYFVIVHVSYAYTNI